MRPGRRALLAEATLEAAGTPVCRARPGARTHRGRGARRPAERRAAAAARLRQRRERRLEWREHLFINADLTVYLVRPPRGEWVGLDSRTVVESDGVGLSESVLHDADGAIGNATQALLVGRRGNPSA